MPVGNRRSARLEEPSRPKPEFVETGPGTPIVSPTDAGIPFEVETGCAVLVPGPEHVRTRTRSGSRSLLDRIKDKISRLHMKHDVTYVPASLDRR